MSLLPHISGLVLPLALGLWCAEETAMTAFWDGFTVGTMLLLYGTYIIKIR